MGRKTYDSLPDRFRPLPRRLNVIITRDGSGEVQRRAAADWKAARRREQEREALKRAAMAGGSQSQDAAVAQANTESAAADGQANEQPEILVSSSLESALLSLRSQFPLNPHKQLGNIFIIGGGEIYASALRLDSQFLRDYSVRILLTDVRRRQGQREQQQQHPHEEEAEEEHPQAGVQNSSDCSPANYDPSQEVDGFECTTFFPLDLDEVGNENHWRRASPAEVTQWAGEEVSGDWKWEGDIAVRMCGYEKVEPAVPS
jgi:dihydrofolate reductase